jgi:hypothetical protein
MKMVEEIFQALWQAIGGKARWLDNSLQHYYWGATDVLP